MPAWDEPCVLRTKPLSFPVTQSELLLGAGSQDRPAPCVFRLCLQQVWCTPIREGLSRDGKGRPGVIILACGQVGGLPRWLVVKKKQNPPANAGEAGSVPGLG